MCPHNCPPHDAHMGEHPIGLGVGVVGWVETALLNSGKIVVNI